ncbi:MAG: chitin disaccharide deacetylase [Clostridiaceae bacterium]
MKLIINADDFGYSPGQNLGIIKAHDEGIVTSTTCLANAPYLEHALSLAKNYPNLGIGVHLVLDMGMPILPRELVPSLVQSDGSFKKFPEDKPLNLSQNEVCMEWSAQVEKIIHSGVRPTHLDGHHHLQLHPDLFEVTLSIAKMYNLPIRYFPYHDESKERKLMAEHEVKMIHGLTDFYKESISPEYFYHFKENHGLIKDEVLELMCHPAYIDDIIYSKSSYNIHRVQELIILTSAEVRNSLFSQGITLGNVRDFL